MNTSRLLAEKRLLWSGVTIAAIAVAALLAVVLWPGGDSEASAAVAVVYEGADGETKTTEFDNLDDAVEFASDKAGFAFTTPSVVPEGFDIAGIGISPSNPRAPELGPKRVTLQFTRGEQGFSVVVVNQRFGAPDQRATRLDLGIAGVDAYTQSTDRATGYWLLTPDRGFLITLVGPDQPTTDELLPMLRSLVE